MLRRIIHTLIFLLLNLTLFNAQASLDSKKSKEFLKVKKQITTSSFNIDYNANLLLKAAQTEYEKAYAYYNLGASKYRSGEFKSAIFYLEQAQIHGKKTDSIDLQRAYTNSLVLSYRRAGLIEQSNEAWDREQKLIKKSKNPYRKAEYYYNLSKINDIDEDYCSSANAKKKYLELLPPEVQKKDPDYIFATLSQLAFSEIKCGNIDDAKHSIEKAKLIIINPLDLPNASLYEIFELANALISVNNKQIEEAKKHFDNAYKISKVKQTITVTKLILSNRLDQDIDTPTTQLQYSKEIENINKFESQSLKKLISYETIKSKERMQSQKTKTNTWILISSISLALLLTFTSVIIRKNKKLQISYEKVISNLDNKESVKQIQNEKETTNNHKVDSNQTKTYVKDKEIDNEAAILMRLDLLEERRTFTSKNFSATQMSALLKTTPRNLSYILKKYRNEDFYNYLNTVRIDYITKELRDNPQLLKYKIAAISDMCGYSSHGQFTTNFRAKTGISPSQYISFLTKELKSQ